MTSPTYIFIQYRKEMVLDDHSVVWALYFDTIMGDVQVDIKDLMTVFPADLDAVIQQTPREKLSDELLKPIKDIIPGYKLERRTVFATFAHNIDHGIHHAYDFVQAKKFIKKFGLDPDAVRIVELGVDSDGIPVLANDGRAQPFAEYFQKDIEQAAAQQTE